MTDARAPQAGMFVVVDNTAPVGGRACQAGLCTVVANVTAARGRQVGLHIVTANPTRTRAYQVGLLVVRPQFEDYPDFVQDLDTQGTREPGIVFDRDSLGGPHGRALAERDRHRFAVHHPLLTGAGRATLDAFYAARRGTPGTPFYFTYQADGIPRLCVFTAPPVYELLEGACWAATVSLAET